MNLVSPLYYSREMNCFTGPVRTAVSNVFCLCTFREAAQAVGVLLILGSSIALADTSRYTDALHFTPP